MAEGTQKRLQAELEKFQAVQKGKNFPSELNWNKKHINILCDEYKLYSDELLINQTLWL